MKTFKPLRGKWKINTLRDEHCAIKMVYHSVAGETLKSSKSVGDLMTEIQKETDERMVASDRSSLEMKAKENVLKKSRAYSQTPPPSKNQPAQNDGKL